MTGMEFVIERLPELLVRTEEHLLLTGLSVGLAVLFGIPIGILVVRKKWLRTVIFSFAAMVQTIPSLAMLAILWMLTGKIGALPAVISLVLYALLPIIQNTVTGFENVSPSKVERKFNLGGTMICHDALLAGEIDIYSEYTGTGLLAILKSETRTASAEEVYVLVKKEYKKKFGIEWLAPFGFNNTYALAIRKNDGQENKWKTISDLQGDANTLTAGFTSEFSERADGYPGLRSTYDLDFGKVVNLDPAIMYEAVREGQVDVITAFSTDSRIEGYGLALLMDDKSYFPPYYAVPVVRGETVSRYPEIKTALAGVDNLINEKTMRFLNYRVDQEKQQVEKVVQEFLGLREKKF